jgi:hypothetical protein
VERPHQPDDGGGKGGVDAYEFPKLHKIAYDYGWKHSKNESSARTTASAWRTSETAPTRRTIMFKSDEVSAMRVKHMDRANRRLLSSLVWGQGDVLHVSIRRLNLHLILNLLHVCAGTVGRVVSGAG